MPKKYSGEDLSAIVRQKYFRAKQNTKKLAQNNTEQKSGIIIAPQSLLKSKLFDRFLNE